MTSEQLTLESLARQTDWIPVEQLSSLAISNAWHSWLLDESSLTKRLIEYSNGNFKVEVLEEAQALPMESERNKLDLNEGEPAQIREVALCCNGSSAVLARSVIPLDVVQEAQSEIAKIGNQPLGHFLFKEGRQRISRRDIALVQLDQQAIPARRTPYQYKGFEILVAEYFISQNLIE